MEIIGHTASLDKNKEALRQIVKNPHYSKLELDFIPTKDNVLVWSHSNFLNGNIVNSSNYNTLKKKNSQLLTLEDVLEEINEKKAILIEIKFALNASKNIDEFIKRLKILTKYNNDVEVQSFNQDLIELLLINKDNLANIHFGLIINIFKTFLYNKHNIEKYNGIDFLALSSELFEWSIFKDAHLKYRELFPDAKQYAWTWDALYKENEERLNNFVNKNVDGIITSNPLLVKGLAKKL